MAAVTKIVLTTNSFFKLLKDSSYDRPSAWWSFCSYAKVSRKYRRLELAMHVEDDSPELRAALKEYFGGKIPKILLSTSWDT